MCEGCMWVPRDVLVLVATLAAWQPLFLSCLTRPLPPSDAAHSGGLIRRMWQSVVATARYGLCGP